MSFKSRFGLVSHPFNVERYRNALPFLWIVAFFCLAMELFMLVMGLWGGHGNLAGIGGIMLPGIIIQFRFAIDARRNIKEFDARIV